MARSIHLLAAATVALSCPMLAQQGPVPGGKCILQFEGSQGGRTTRSTLTKLPTGKYNAYIGGGFVGHCQGQDVTLRSDSAEYYGDQSLLYLINDVHYIEPRATVDADHMTYWTDEGHLRAEGNVYAVMASGTTMRGPVADYYRVIPGVRTQTLLVATGRPTINLVQIDSVTRRPTDTVRVLADRITSVADSLVYAGGDVHVTRPELLATGDSAFVDQGLGRARLLIKPTVEARRDRPFTLTGGVIDVFSTNRQVDRVVASPDGHATSEDLQLYADSVDLRVRSNTLERAMAWGKTRAHAIAPERDILADSIDAILPNQHIRNIIAVGKAYATGIADSTLRTTERDWMRGDTLVATFDTVARTDSGRTPPIRSLVASVQARAFYHVKGNGSDSTRPGINYVTGRVITIAFDTGAVQTVTVLDQASGIYLEPQDSTKSAPRAKPGAKTPRPAPVTPPAPARTPGIRKGEIR